MVYVRKKYPTRIYRKPANKRVPYRPYKKRYRKFKRMGIPSGMPSQRITKLSYVQNTELTSNLGVITSKLFRANSAFNPSVSSGGHQPYGYDQWALLFNHYVVLGSKITVKVINSIPNGTSPSYMGCYLSDDITIPYTDAYQLMEAGKGSYRLNNPGNNRALTFGSKYSAKKFFNVTNVKDNYRLGAPNNASPDEGAVYHIWFQTGNGSTSTVYLSVRMEFIVSWSEPIDLPTSS